MTGPLYCLLINDAMFKDRINLKSIVFNTHLFLNETVKITGLLKLFTCIAIMFYIIDWVGHMCDHARNIIFYRLYFFKYTT